MACKINPQVSSNALKNLSDMFVVKGQKSLLDFIEEADKHLDSMHENQFNHLKDDIGRFIKELSKNKSRRPRSRRPSRRRTAGGSWQDPSQGPYRPPANPLYPVQIVAPVQMAPVPLDQGQQVQMVQDPVQGPPIQMVQGAPVHMPRGPQGRGIVRGLIRVGATFLLPRTTTGIIYSGLWLSVALMAGFAGQSQQAFFKAGIEQITSGDCMGVTGRFTALRHPLCTRWQVTIIPMLDALNQLMNFDPRGFGVLVAGIAMIVTGPLLIDAMVYELAFSMDYVITTALQSFSGRPLIPPTRSATRPNIPHLMGRMLTLTNPGAMSALSLGQNPTMSHVLGNQYFVPIPGQPGYGQPYAQAYPVPYAQPMMQQPMMQPMMQQPMMQQPMQQPMQPQQAAALWDPQMAPPPARPPRGRRVDRVFNANQLQRNANNANAQENAAYEAYRQARARSASLRRSQARAPNRGGPGNGGPANGRRSSNRNRGGPGNGSGNGSRKSSRRSSGR